MSTHKQAVIEAVANLRLMEERLMHVAERCADKQWIAQRMCYVLSNVDTLEAELEILLKWWPHDE